MIHNLERFIKLLENDGTLTDRTAGFLEEIVKQVNLGEVLRGNGSPEGVVEANPNQEYWDEIGKVKYFKDIGTGNTGWELL